MRAVIEMLWTRYCRRGRAGWCNERIEPLMYGPMGHHCRCENRRYRYGSGGRLGAPCDADRCRRKHDERDERDRIVAARQDE
jgi:hypothetical protein